ncbi:Kelch repeat type 1 [Corchorus olitorius]|uniref:Kelch repeat type 1 n=1 Tax=Corchorus olitorius TaxID=93759 RepID=A0A1R3IIQ6_9ROSI|nr:Kelch repeat type 1 [Corchorus olitorius]
MSHTVRQFLKPSTAVSAACASAAETSESYNEKETEHEKASVYLVYERQQSRRFCINLHTFNLKENKGGLLEIPPSLQTKSSSINVCASAVALGSVIYLIGGCCGHPINVCYEDITVPHVHNSVVYFDTLKPDNGWREAARMKSNRNLPTVVAVDGAVMDDILYIYSTKFKQVHGYDLINKTSDYDDGFKIICNTFKIRKEMNGDQLLHLTAIKVSDTNSFITAHTFWEMNVLML